MKKLMLLFLITPFIVNAQYRGCNWAISDSILLTFNHSKVNIGSSSLRETNDLPNRDELEPMATISDDSGKLLFYTNGWTVWNRNNKIMMNGDSLLCGFSITDGVVITPYPGHDSLYYIFYQYPLSYTIVNMNLDSGLGGITKKNVTLLPFGIKLSEKLTVVKHGNGMDWWLVGDTLVNNCFYRFLITPDSIYGPYWQNIGLAQKNYSQGQICFSQEGNKLGMVNNKSAEVFDFDRCTGELSNDIVLDTLGYYGCSFSPNGSKFYISNDSKLYQFNLSNAKPSSTKTLIFNDPYYFGSHIFNDSTYWFGQQELALDGEIYIVMGYVLWPDNSHYSFQDMNLCVINQPDSLGLACDFQPYSLYLGGHRTTDGLPNMPNYNLGALESTGAITSSNDSICEGSGLISLLNANSTVGSLQWQSSTDGIHFSSLSGDTLSSYTTSDTVTKTTYYRLVAGGGSCVDSSNIVAVNIVPLPTTSFKDSISGNVIFFSPDSTSKGITTYSWDFGDSTSSTLQNPSHTYNHSATFTVCLTVYNGSNCSYTICKDVGFVLTGTNPIVFQNSIQVYPNPAQDELTVELSGRYTPRQIEISDALGRNLLTTFSRKQNTQMNIHSLSAGIYFVKVQMNDGSLQVRKFVKE